MQFDATDRFFRRLNPTAHFAPDGPNSFRVSSAAFKGTPKQNGRYVSSVDAERLRPLDEERASAAKEHPGYGIGAIQYQNIQNVGAELKSTPQPNNPSHHDVHATQPQAGKLAKATTVIDWPADPIETG